MTRPNQVSLLPLSSSRRRANDRQGPLGLPYVRSPSCEFQQRHGRHAISLLITCNLRAVQHELAKLFIQSAGLGVKLSDRSFIMASEVHGAGSPHHHSQRAYLGWFRHPALAHEIRS